LSPWYEEKGVNFACTRCGKCCHLSKRRVVRVNDREIQAIAQHLNESLKSVRRDRVESGRGVLRGKVNARGERVCTFLTEDNLCLVEKAKPTQCRTYPFWPEVVASSYEWRAEQVRCEGIEAKGEAKVVTREEIRFQLVLETLSRLAGEAGESGGLSHSESESLLSEVDDSLLEEFEEEHVRENRRVVRHDGREHAVVDFFGDYSSAGPEVDCKRVLISKQAPWLAQSEVYVRADGNVCRDLLPQGVQQGLLAACALPKNLGSLCFLGSGACVASTVLSALVPDAKVEAWDLDGEMFDLAESYFGAEFPGEGGKVEKRVRDAAEIVGHDAAFDVILLDICSIEEVPSSPTSFVGAIPPPKPFLQKEFLCGVLEKLNPGGVLALHLAHRDNKGVVKRIAEEAGTGRCVYSLEVPGGEGDSCVVFLSSAKVESGDQLKELILGLGPLRKPLESVTRLLEDRPQAWERES